MDFGKTDQKLGESVIPPCSIPILLFLCPQTCPASHSARTCATVFIGICAAILFTNLLVLLTFFVFLNMFRCPPETMDNHQLWTPSLHYQFVELRVNCTVFKGSSNVTKGNALPTQNGTMDSKTGYHS
jgi:hypothetical protein